MRIPHGAKNSGTLIADTAVKSSSGVVLGIVLAYKNVTAGEFCTLIDGTDITGSDKITLVFPGANGTLSPNLGRYGIYFLNGIFFNKGATAGDVFATVVYE